MTIKKGDFIDLRSPQRGTAQSTDEQVHSNSESKTGSVVKGDFVELKYTGVANGEVFDSNIEEDIKKINPKAKPEKTIVVVGEKMLVTGLDNALEGKELNKPYETKVPFKEGFGPRYKELIRILPLKSFLEKEIRPYPGMMLALDQSIVKILAVSSSRVTVDFNNPLAGKDLTYKYTIIRIVTDEKEKAEAVIQYYLKAPIEFEIKENNLILKGPKMLEIFVQAFKDKFKSLLNKDLTFEFKAPQKGATHEHSHDEHDHDHEGHDHSHEHHEHEHTHEGHDHEHSHEHHNHEGHNHTH